MSAMQQALLMASSSAVSVITLSTSVPTADYNLFVQAGSPTGVADVTLTINSGGYLYGSSNVTYALDTGTGWVAGSTLTVINNGGIYGYAGVGALETATNNLAGYNGQNAGPAVNAQYAVSIVNNSVVAGGGGGGGSGGNINNAASGGWTLNSGGNGGGFAVSTGGNGGSGVNNAPPPTTGGRAGGAGGAAGQQGAAYTVTGTPNAFYNTAVFANSGSGGGGGGGGLGSYGGNGQNSQNLSVTYNGGTGGAGGKVAVSSSNITWSTPGIRYGRLDSTPYTYLGGPTITYVSSTPGVAASLQFSVRGDGVINDFGTYVTRSVVNGTMPQSWYQPNTASIGSSYWVRLTIVSGSTPGSGTVGSWLALSSTQTWIWTSATTGVSTVGATVLVEISTSAGGSPVVTSGTYIVAAQHV
jgi:hypothetical protein